MEIANVKTSLIGDDHGSWNSRNFGPVALVMPWLVELANFRIDGISEGEGWWN